MSQQYNKVIKRRRRNAYLKRKKLAAKARKGSPRTKPATAAKPPTQTAAPASA